MFKVVLIGTMVGGIAIAPWVIAHWWEIERLVMIIAIQMLAM